MSKGVFFCTKKRCRTHFEGIEKKIKNGLSEENQRFALDLACPKAYKGTSSGKESS